MVRNVDLFKGKLAQKQLSFWVCKQIHVYTLKKYAQQHELKITQEEKRRRSCLEKFFFRWKDQGNH